MAKSPEDELFEALWSDEPRRNPLTFKAGETYVSVTEPVVWLPFLVLLVIGWVALAALLPPEAAGRFIELTLGSLARAITAFSIPALGLLAGNIVGLAVAFYCYTWIFRWIVGWLLESSSR